MCLDRKKMGHLKDVYLGVSLNGGTPKSSILIIFKRVFHMFSIIFTIHFWGPTPIFWKHPFPVGVQTMFIFPEEKVPDLA